MGTVAIGQEQVACTIHVLLGKSIQQAIDTAPKGAVICLEKGEWQESIEVEKSITLQGAGAEHSVIRGTEEGALF